MKASSASVGGAGNVTSIQGVLDALPKTTPRKVIETLEKVFNLGGSRLPPEVFFETVEQASVAISITDPKANILYANPAFKTLTGYEPSEVIGRNESILSFKTTPASVYQTMWGALREQKSWTGLLVNRRKDGKRYLADLTITPIRGVEGATSHYLAMHRDVTAVHELERKVKNQKALIESVVDAAPIAFALLDEREQVVLDNHEYKKLIGDLGVAEPAAHVLGVLRSDLGEAFAEARASGRGFGDREVRVEHSGSGEPRWFSCSGSWFEEEDAGTDGLIEPARETYMLLVMKEVTAARREQERQRINAVRTMMADAELAERLRETLAGAIYQLQGPLNLIQAAVNVAERRSGNGDREALADVLRQALESGQRSLATLQASMPEHPEEAEMPVNLNEILRDVLMLLTERLIGAGITVDWKPAPVLPKVNGQPNMLRNMFKQLIENAIDAMNEKGRTLRELRLDTHPATAEVHVHIEDTGPGIPEPLRIKVFEPFFTTKEHGRHSVGMGLAMAQEVVSRHDGMMEIDADYIQGCRIELRFPTTRSRVS